MPHRPTLDTAMGPLLWIRRWIQLNLATVLRMTVLGELASFGRGFNLDERIPTIRHGPNNSDFGFTVAQYIEPWSNRSSLLVGAPKAQTVQPNVFRGGAVYSCPLGSNATCYPIAFDETGNNVQWDGHSYVAIENKTLQWFGATLAVSKDGHILACAPLYVHFSKSNPFQSPVGSCYLGYPNQTSFRRSSPCDPGVQISCHNGFSATFGTDSSVYATGAVGSYYWQGQVFLENHTVVNDLKSTREGTSITDDYSYKGYAVVSGSFGSGYNQDFVAGIPRGNSLTGKIVFLNGALQPMYEVSGEQVGEYFGSSISVDDFNGDGRDDVAVGAPFYSSSSNYFDAGRVYVFYQTKQNGFQGTTITRLNGNQKTHGRFGWAVCRSGDLNLDGFRDLAVGAPYDGPGGRGAVYIFHGSANGIRTKETQICYAETFGLHLLAFGLSLSGGTDLDRNEYPDLLIGAYKSNAVVYLRSRPVIRVTAVIKVDPEFIDIEEKNCTLSTGTPVACYSITFCASYTGKKVPPEAVLRFQWLLDSWKTRSMRTAFLSQTLSLPLVQMRLRRRQTRCVSRLAYIKETIRDKLTPIQVEVNFSLVETNTRPTELRPILDIYSVNPVFGQGHIMNECGEDRICIPDLRVEVNSTRDYYTLDTEDEFSLKIVVENNREDAFETIVTIELPEGVCYINVNNVTASTEVVCDSVQMENSTLKHIVCDIGNPLPSSERVAFEVRLTASKISQKTTKLRFTVHVNSSNPENTASLADNMQIFDFRVKAILNIVLAGMSFPQQVLYNYTEVTKFVSEDDVGPKVLHRYQIRNNGPGVIGSMQTLIKWPSNTRDGLPLFYLFDEPLVTHGTGWCHTDDINPMNFNFSDTKELDSRIPDDRLRSDLSLSDRLRLRRHVSLQSDNDIAKVSCGEGMEGRCSLIECNTGPLGKGESVIIEIQARVFYRTISQMKTRYHGVLVRSEASTFVKSAPYAVKPEVSVTDKFSVETYVITVVSGETILMIEFWMIAVAIFAGCVLMLLLVALLWRCGFFERSLRAKLHQGQVKYESMDNDPVDHHIRR